MGHTRDLHIGFRIKISNLSDKNQKEVAKLRLKFELRLILCKNSYLLNSEFKLPT
jgi:hypothetical protein